MPVNCTNVSRKKASFARPADDARQHARNLGCAREAYIQWDIHVNVTGGDGSFSLRGRRWRAAGLGRSAGMTPHALPLGRFSKPIVLRDRAPLATLDEARAFLSAHYPPRKLPRLFTMHA